MAPTPRRRRVAAGRCAAASRVPGLGPLFAILMVALTPSAALAQEEPLRAAGSSIEFPSGHEGFHTYAEMRSRVAATAAAHPRIMQRFSLGRTYQGREIWAAKISDNAATDEAEPEVLFDGLHHGREHMGLEMTLAILRWLTGGYGNDERVTRLVNSREIWIVFAVNPDGAEYDISGGRYHYWRKNRQPNAGTTNVGTDLNRNYDYRWGCCGGSSSYTGSIMYRGAAPFSAPESRRMRDFINSRVIDGRQQITTAITFHTAGRLVMWPYGYTYTDLPGDMTALDHRVFLEMGRTMAASNGYTPEQASDLYISSGTTRDWEYGRHRIFAFTFELTPGAFYPDDSTIGPETGRNRNAILYLIDAAGCPYRLVGEAAKYCGPFFDDLEIRRGWQVDPLGTDTATAGGWQRANPEGTSSAGVKQVERASSGLSALVTGAAAGAAVWSNDLDGGTTSVRSAAITIPASGRYTLRFRYYLAHGSNATSGDFLRVSVAGDQTTVLFQERGSPVDDDAAWDTVRVAVPDRFRGQRVRILVEAGDLYGGSLVEAGIDDVSIIRS
ncbi:MAG: zinc carboxypeptidase [Chloroflexi bacterium]|nr:zinc carboxypeptidase [Chloroflexota bacterium]